MRPIGVNILSSREIERFVLPSPIALIVLADYRCECLGYRFLGQTRKIPSAIVPSERGERYLSRCQRSQVLDSDIEHSVKNRQPQQ